MNSWERGRGEIAKGEEGRRRRRKPRGRNCQREEGQKEAEKVKETEREKGAKRELADWDVFLSFVPYSYAFLDNLDDQFFIVSVVFFINISVGVTDDFCFFNIIPAWSMDVAMNPI